MTERIVTTIGDLSDGLPTRGAPPLPRRRPPWARYDGLDSMLDISGTGDDGEIDPTSEDPIYVPGVSFTPNSPPATAIPEPGPTSSGGASVPAGAKAAGWKLGDGRYVLQSGDTLSGLAGVYLSASSRWPEIWNLQPSTYRSSRTPDKIFAGDVLQMPAEAQAKARALGLYGVGANVLGRGFTKGEAVGAVAAAGAAIGAWLHFRKG